MQEPLARTPCRNQWMGWRRCLVVGLVVVLASACNNTSTAPSAPLNAATSAGPRNAQQALAELCPTKPNTTRLRVDGRDFFPFGFYHVSWAGSDEVRAQALQAIGRGGFNVMHPAIDANDAAFLRVAQQLGVKIIVEFNEDPPVVIAQHKNKPAIIGWNIADDVDNGRRTPAEVARIHRQTKALDPSRFTYVSGGAKTPAFADAVDVVAVQVYPIGNDGLALNEPTKEFATMRAALPNKPLIANLQTFAWPERRPPTPREVRSMTYQTLMQGVDGIIYYTYFDATWNIEQHPQLWEELVALAEEVRLFAPVLLASKPCAVATSTASVQVALWPGNSKAYLAVANLAAEQAHPYTLAWPSELNEPFCPLVTSAEATLPEVRDGQLRGTLSAAEVQIYEIGLAQQGCSARKIYLPALF